MQKQANRTRASQSSRPLTREDFVAWGKAGVRARMRKLTAEERREVAKKAAQARWTKGKT